jgi:hypothetical protein
LFCSACEASSCPDFLPLCWRLSLISLHIAAYAWNKPVSSACQSRNLQNVCLSASALSLVVSTWRHFHSRWANFEMAAVF